MRPRKGAHAMPFIEERIRITTDKCFLELKNQGQSAGSSAGSSRRPRPVGSGGTRAA